MFTASLTLLIALTAVTMISARPEPSVIQYLPPNQQYGLPERTDYDFPSVLDAGFDQVNQYLPPNRQYGVPGTRNGIQADGTSDVPAKYEFEYTVNDPESGNDFGHKEIRNDDMTRGVFYVLLPDGRRQIVEYEADQDGYRPKVTYLQEGPGIGSGNRIGRGYPGVLVGYRY